VAAGGVPVVVGVAVPAASVAVALGVAVVLAALAVAVLAVWRAGHLNLGNALLDEPSGVPRPLRLSLQVMVVAELTLTPVALTRVKSWSAACTGKDRASNKAMALKKTTILFFINTSMDFLTMHKYQNYLKIIPEFLFKYSFSIAIKQCQFFDLNLRFSLHL
jgi:hypothetical protein